MANVLQFPAARPATPAPDTAIREHALDTTASFLVEAPAGSGKTALLVHRFLKLLADTATQQPEEVLAITFTRKAVAELRDRILQPLLRARATPIPENLKPFDAATHLLALDVLAHDAALGWGLLDRPQRLAVRTIDSLCAELAASMPLLSGGIAARVPTENAQPLYRQAAQRTLRLLGGPDAALHHALYTVLLHRDASLTDTETLLARMLAQREQWGELIPLGEDLRDDVLENEIRPRLEHSLQQIVCEGLTRATKALPPDMLSALSWLAARLAHEPGYKGAPSPLQICANKQEPPEAHADHLEHWLALIHLLFTKEGKWRSGFAVNHLGLALSAEDKTLLKELIDQSRDNESLREALCNVRKLPSPRYPENQWQVAKALFRLLIRALVELKLLFNERETCDFTELALAARQALRSASADSGLAALTGSPLRHLLVDEMQDTSSSQYDLIELLTRSWDGHSQTLFLVGDPKQSIYLFRQARVERFLRTMRAGRLGDLPLTSLRLTANFRSQAALVEAFNLSFEDIFPTPSAAPADGVPFVAAHATRPVSPDTRSIVWHACVKKEFTHEGIFPEADEILEEQNHRKDEARSLCRIVQTWRANPLPADRKRDEDGDPIPWQIAILARTREHLAPVIAELRAARVPFTAVDIERLGEQPEVLDLLALTRALHHPADRTAWLAVLHAPWCGLGLADLLCLATGDSQPTTHQAPLPTVLTTRAHLLSPEGRALFDRAFPILVAALAQRGRTSATTWVERTWRSLGADAALDQNKLANAQLFFATLRKLEQPGALIDLAELTSALKDLFVRPNPSPDAVTLSTIHNAKGLEWDVVLVPGLERTARGNDAQILNWLELDNENPEDAHILLAPIASRGEDPDPLYAWINSVRAVREAAERKRLFYVACTRAKEELHLFAAATRRSTTHDLYAPARSLLESAWPAAQHQFDQPATDAAAPSSPTVSSSARVGLVGASPTNAMFRNALSADHDTLALAASAEPPTNNPLATARGQQTTSSPPLLHRLPLSFHPAARFAGHAATRLPYTPASALPASSPFDRPEGSFAVRAFGNVVHRFLQLLADQLAQPDTLDPRPLTLDPALYLPRLTASLRAEGLSPTGLDPLAQRALLALQNTLADPVGLWLLSPHPSASSEHTLASSTGDLRVDRIFLTDSRPPGAPSSTTVSSSARVGSEQALWIVDFKTTEQGSRTPEAFAAQERAKYAAQLETYARIQRTLTDVQIHLGLYYPLVPRLIHWPSA